MLLYFISFPNAIVFAGTASYRDGVLALSPQALTKSHIKDILRARSDWQGTTSHIVFIVAGLCGFIAFIMGYAVYSGT